MPKNNGKARKSWRRGRAILRTTTLKELLVETFSRTESLSDNARPGTRNR